MNMIKQNHLPVQKTSRYFSIGEDDSKKNLWIVLHGYSQLAEAFIKNFEELHDEQSFIVAPEGLSRFYVKGYFGKVGASWMTKEDRMTDILDNIHYLDTLLKHLLNEFKYINKVIVLGFSQGGATAARWAAITNLLIHHLVIYSSEFPKDITDEALQHLNEKVQTFLVYSNNDEFIDVDLFNQQFIYLQQKKFTFEKIYFEGKHEINSKSLLELKSKMGI
jgi:predicted esterase